jgi:hypothetical protein
MQKLVHGSAVIAAIAAMVMITTRAAAQVSVQGNTVRERETQPGETYTGSFAIVNSSAEPQEAKLYQTDYRTNADGSNLYGAPGSTARSNARWITFGATSVVIPPRSSKEVPFTVTVPTGQPLAGSYWSMLMVEGVARGSAESTLPPAQRNTVQAAFLTRIRYAVQIVTHVGTATKPEARFVAPGVSVSKDGSRVLHFDVVNTGIQSFFPAFTLELYAQDGTRVKTASATREITYPGTSLRQQFDLGPVPAGTYRALVTMDAGNNAVFGAQYTLKL